MPNSFQKLASQALTADVGGALAAIYTAPALTEVFIRHMRVVNQDAGAQKTVTMWQKTGALTGADDDFLILPPVPIEAGGWAEFEGTIVIPAGESLYANASAANDVTLFVYGMEKS